jgi:hypothetical protein
VTSAEKEKISKWIKHKDGASPDVVFPNQHAERWSSSQLPTFAQEFQITLEMAANGILSPAHVLRLFSPP